MTLLWKLLRSHLSVAQTVGFALAGVVGMTIVLTSVQAYRDVMPVFDAPDSFMRGDYLVLSKRVGALQTIGLGSSDFTPGELEELKGQPFVRDVGAFTPANYRVKGTVGMGGVQLSTYLFFEAVPDRFLDVASGKWKYEPGDGDIPIIIPRNYLNLYNYGFAKSQGLPQISEGIFQRVSLGIEVAGNGRTEQFRGRIVGLSNRLNTILVPESFIRWSNGRFGQGGEKQASRVIVETDRPVDAAISAYLDGKGYEAEGDRRDSGKAAYFLQLAAGGLGGVGLVFSVMSFYILMLSIFLLLQKNSAKLENLLLLGYAPGRVARPYWLLTLWLNLGVLVVAVVLSWLVRMWYLPELAALQEGYAPAGVGVTWVCGIGLALLLSLSNGIAIRRRIDTLNRKRSRPAALSGRNPRKDRATGNRHSESRTATPNPKTRVCGDGIPLRSVENCREMTIFVVSNIRTMNRIVAPSMLSADFGHLERDTQMVDRSAAEWVHIDVMDGVFVPNISFGFPVLKAIRKVTAKCLDVHLMIVEPERYVARFAEAGADIVTFHYEATYDPRGCIEMIRKAGAKAGVSIKPATSVEVLRDILPLVDLVLVMSVEPGFGGQSFIPASTGKIRALRAMARELGLQTIIEVDGGISSHNSREVYEAGADVLVAGNAVFGAEDPQAEIVRMLNA